MRFFLLVPALIICLVTIPVTPSQGAVPAIIIKAIVKKVLRAMDLAVQRLQNVTIKLQNAQKAVENALSKLKLGEIHDWSEKQRDLFAEYYDELHKVKSAITYYRRVKNIIEQQVQLVAEYKRAVSLIKNSKQYSPDEIVYIMDVYAGILDESVRNIDQIGTVIKSFSFQMSDAARLELIHRTDEAIMKNMADLRAFTKQNVVLSLQRTKDAVEINTLKSLYNIDQK